MPRQQSVLIQVQEELDRLGLIHATRLIHAIRINWNATLDWNAIDYNAITLIYAIHWKVYSGDHSLAEGHL
jgi:hypothetical protein